MLETFDLRDQCELCLTGDSIRYKKLEHSTESGDRYLYFRIPHNDSKLEYSAFEIVNEVIASRLGSLLGLPVMQYNLATAFLTETEVVPVSVMTLKESFSGSILTLRDLMKLKGTPDERPYKFISDRGFRDYVNALIVFDFLVGNRNRNLDTIKFIYQNKRVHLLPILDLNYSFVPELVTNPVSLDDLDAYLSSYEFSYETGNDLFRTNLSSSLSLCGESVWVHNLTPSWKNLIFDDIDEDYCPVEYRDFIWDEIVRRYNLLLEEGHISVISDEIKVYEVHIKESPDEVLGVLTLDMNSDYCKLAIFSYYVEQGMLGDLYFDTWVNESKYWVQGSDLRYWLKRRVLNKLRLQNTELEQYSTNKLIDKYSGQSDIDSLYLVCKSNKVA